MAVCCRRRRRAARARRSCNKEGAASSGRPQYHAAVGMSVRAEVTASCCHAIQEKVARVAGARTDPWKRGAQEKAAAGTGGAVVGGAVQMARSVKTRCGAHREEEKVGW